MPMEQKINLKDIPPSHWENYLWTNFVLSTNKCLEIFYLTFDKLKGLLWKNSKWDKFMYIHIKIKNENQCRKEHCIALKYEFIYKSKCHA